MLNARTIKERVHIEEVIGSEYPLKAQGRLLVGDRDDCDSLKIDPKKQVYAWWSHDHYGDVFDWLMETRGMDFREAVETANEFNGLHPDLPPSVAFKKSDERPRKPIDPSAVAKFNAAIYESAGFNFLLRRGIDDLDIERYKLGYIPNYNNICGVITIPVMNGDSVATIRLRAIDPDKVVVRQTENGPKEFQLPRYSYFQRGCGVQLFNSSVLGEKVETVVIVEGEFKAITCCKYGLRAVGIMGVSSMKAEWFPMFKNAKRVIVALDPDQNPYNISWVGRLAAYHGNVRAIQLFDKIDDLILQHGVSPVVDAISSARRIPGGKVSPISD